MTDYALELDDVGVPDGEGESWGELAERLRREAGTFPHPHAVGTDGGDRR